MAKKKTGRQLAEQTQRDYYKALEKTEKQKAGELAPTETDPIVPLERIDIKAITKSFKRQSTIAKKKKGKEGPVKKSIRVLMGKMESPGLPELLYMFKQDDDIEHLFNSLSEPRIDIHLIEVYVTPDINGEKEYISYTVRDECKPRKTKFKTLQNHILKIRNS